MPPRKDGSRPLNDRIRIMHMLDAAHTGTTADSVILRKLVEAGPAGVPTSTLGEMLGRRGKATRGAARQWAQCMGIATDGGVDPFEECRVGTQRGLRIKASILEIAKAHLK